MDPKQWTQGAYARDARGAPVGPHHANARRWCLAGAILKCGGGVPHSHSLIAGLAFLFAGSTGVVHTNDDKGHGAVMELLDRMREKAKALGDSP